jgi:hypothetical protein
MADPRLKRFGLLKQIKQLHKEGHLKADIERTLQRVRVQPLGGQIRLNGVLVRLKGNDGYIKSFFNQYS